MNTSLNSSVYPQDPKVFRFLEVVSTASPEDDAANIVGAVNALGNADCNQLMQHLYVVVDQLVGLLTVPSSDGELCKQSFRALASVVGVAHNVTHEAHSVALQAYVNNVYANDAGRKKQLYAEVVTYWVMLVGDRDSSAQSALKHAWFFFALASKSMLLSLGGTPGLRSGRRNRFSASFRRDLSKLVATASRHITAAATSGYTTAKNLSANLAYFLRGLLSFMDRGFVFQLIQDYLTDASAPTDLQAVREFKCDFVRIVCNHEHFVALNLPFAAVAERPLVFSPLDVGSAIEAAVAAATAETEAAASSPSSPGLSATFAQQHHLAAMLLDELHTSITDDNRTVRKKVFDAVKALMAKLSVDPRYGDRAAQGRVASLFFPVVVMALDHARLLTPVSPSSAAALDSSAGSASLRDEVLDAFDAEETRDFLVCVLWVLKSLDPAFLRAWWESESQPRVWALFDVLGMAIQAFEYVGKAQLPSKINALASNASGGAEKSATDAKRALEERYARTGGGTVGPKGRVATIKSSTGSVVSLGSASGSGSSKTLLRGEQPHGKRRFASLRPASANYKTMTKEDQRKFVEEYTLLEGHLSNEIGLVVLDLMELCADAHRSTLLARSGDEERKTFVDKFFAILFGLLQRPQSDRMLRHVFAAVRYYVNQFPELFFDGDSTYCAELCHQVLQFCNSPVEESRTHATATMYMIMKTNFQAMGNFARTQVQCKSG